MTSSPLYLPLFKTAKTGEMESYLSTPNYVSSARSGDLKGHLVSWLESGVVKGKEMMLGSGGGVYPGVEDEDGEDDGGARKTTQHDRLVEWK